MEKGGSAKRKASQMPEFEDNKSTRPLQKRVKTFQPKPKPEPEHLEVEEEPRNLKDLWKSAFPVMTSWWELDRLYGKFDWDFSNLEREFVQGGKLHHEIHGENNKKNVYVFVTTEPHIVEGPPSYKCESIPVVVAISSLSPPSQELAYKITDSSRPGGREEAIIPMKEMKMGWIPYIPMDKRGAQVERLTKKSLKIYYLGCKQRKAALERLERGRYLKIQYSVPYIVDHNSVEEENEQDFEVELPAAEHAREEQKEARRPAFAKMREEMARELALAKNMRIYKFYPVQTPHTPLVEKKLAKINNYCRDADEVFWSHSLISGWLLHLHSIVTDDDHYLVRVAKYSSK